MMEIQTLRARLRRPNSSDLENMQRLESNPLIIRHTPSRVPQNAEQSRERLTKQIQNQAKWEPFGIWMAELKADSSFIGWFMLMPQEPDTLELGFMLVEEKWNQGLATEISQALIEFAKNFDQIKFITAKTDLNNNASIRCLEKLGFDETETISRPDPILGKDCELKTFALHL